ncbi:MAG: hypothetical protein AAB837_02060 [Patescibacteria group bacterium]
MLATFLTTKKHFINRGVTLIETIIYIVLLVFVMSLIVQTLVATSGVYRNIKLTRELESSGTIAMESMLREIRNASSVVVSESELLKNPGVLTVFGIDEDSNSYSITFDVSSSTIRISKNGSIPTALTSSSGVVSYLMFTQVATSTSEGVRIELEMSGVLGLASSSERFYGFSVLRGSY